MSYELDYVVTKRPKSFRRLKDIEIIETQDPKVLLGKYLYKHILRTWKEDFTDDDTGETTEVERNEIMWQKSPAPLSATDVQKIQFLYQSYPDMEPAKVTRERLPDIDYSGIERGANMLFTLHYSLENYNYLVRAKSVEDAIQIILDYGSLYCNIEGFVHVMNMKLFTAKVADNRDKESLNAALRRVQREEGDQSEPEWYQYYSVTGKLNYFDSDLGKQQSDSATVLVLGQNAGDALMKAEDAFHELWQEILDTNADSRVITKKAVPFKLDFYVPDGYVKEWYERAEQD